MVNTTGNSFGNFIDFTRDGLVVNNVLFGERLNNIVVNQRSTAKGWNTNVKQEHGLEKEVERNPV